MPKKSKKGGKKGKKKEKKDEKKPEEAVELNPRELYIDPIRDAVKCKLSIRLINPQLPGIFDTYWECKTSTKLFQVERFIKEYHGGSIRNIRMCAGQSFAEDLVLKDMSKKL